MFTSGKRYINLSFCWYLHVSQEDFLQPIFSYFTLAGDSEERLTDLIYRLKTIKRSNDRTGVMDFKQKQLVLWFCRSAGAPRPSFEKTYGGFPCIEQTFYTTLGIFYSLCIWKLHRSGVVDPRLNLPLRSKRTIFNTVRQILIHFFVILFTAF